MLVEARELRQHMKNTLSMQSISMIIQLQPVSDNPTTVHHLQLFSPYVLWEQIGPPRRPRAV
eukprot:scaffold8605_cov178-Amphora_coffeaeformis.AAC.13